MDLRTPLTRGMRGFVLVPLLLAAGVLLTPGSGFAAQAEDVPFVSEDADVHDGHETAADMPPLLNVDLGSAIWNLLIFLVVLSILGKFVWPQILAGLQARESRIRNDLESAEKANRDAKLLLADYQRQLDEAQGKVQEMLAEARRDAERVGAGIVEEAKSDAERQRQRALADIETAKSVAMTELANQTSDLAISLARQVVGRELNPNDHAELIRQSLERIPSRN